MYKANKMGLLNFWLYDDEEFTFGDGKLLLRGQNGSGKSVTMQSFIPLILDGNKSPKRLDTFGSTDKHIEYYLLGDNKEEATSYLYMEFYDSSLDKYTTIGIYLHARRGRNVDFGGFCLKDGKRVNVDNFHLYKCIDGINKVPLTKIELKSAIGPGNMFVETAKEYKNMVNDLLFGFSSIDSFDEFINLLLQIRSPKLSKEYTPTKLMDTLNEVLPPLNEEDIRSLSDGIENMNEYKEKLDKTKSELKSLSNFILAFNNYNKGILKKKSKNLLDKQKTLNVDEKNYSNFQKEIKGFEEELKNILNNKATLDKEYTFAKSKKETLNIGKLEESTKRLGQLNQEIAKLEKEIKDLNTKNNEVFRKKELIEKEIENYETKLNNINQEITNLINQSISNASKINYDSYIEILNMALENKNFDIASLRNLLKKQEEIILNCLELLKKRSNLEQKINDVSTQYNSYTHKQEDLEIKLKNLKNDLNNELEDLIRKLKDLKDNNIELLIDDDTYHKIINLFETYNKDSYLEAKELYYICAEGLKKTISSQINTYLVDLNIKKEEKNKLNKSLEELENTKEVIIDEDTLINASTEELKTRNINFVYLYQVVDFKDTISNEDKNNLEETLYTSGILGAKIINLKDQNNIKNLDINYLVPSTFKKDNLTKYLIPLKNDIVCEDYINKILESISLNSKDNLNISLNGYKFDFLQGNISNNYENKYIGLLARENLRKKKIAALKDKITILNEKMNSIEGIVSSLTGKINHIDEEKLKFPQDNVLSSLELEITKINLSIENNTEQMNYLSEELNQLQKNLLELNKNINDYRGNIPLNLDSYKAALEIINSLKDNCNLLELKSSELSSTKKFLSDKKIQQDEYQSRISEYNMKIINSNNTLDIYTSQRNAIEEVINSKENKNLKEEILRLDTIINNYNEKNSNISKKIGNLETMISNLKNDIEKKVNTINKDKILVNIAKKIFDEELSLGYINYLDLDFKTDYSLKDVDVLYQQLTNINLDNIDANYYNAINTYRQELIDYNLKDINLFNDTDFSLKDYLDKGLELSEIEQELKASRRSDVTFTFQGKIINPYILNDSLNDKYIADKMYLDEQDKKLFYETLVKITGEKIKRKILLAEEWVKNTNKIMQEHSKDSNLSFYLEWHPKDADTTVEMSTKDLVNLFRKDINTIKDDDIKRLVNHFRSKIDRAEEDSDTTESYFQVIFDVLDYRNWFQFKLFYRKDGSDKKELTNKIFSVFSGGEKAKTMYVPLFASVYAKLDDARNNAPRLIAMDEAFAGVDDQNIEEMFAILNSFNLDYLLTSQILWCTYSNVKSINISELIHPRGASSIGIHRYHWDGKIKTYLLGEN